MRTVSFRRLTWSDDGKTIFLGYATWDDKPPTPGRAGGRGASAEGDANTSQTPARGAARGGVEPDEPAGVDIWHWMDPVVMARQKLSATQDRRRNLLATWNLDSGKLVPIAKSYTETVSPIRHTNTALVSEWSAFAMDRSIGRPAADLYVADLTTGARTKLKDNVNDRFTQVSPGGKYLLFLQDDQYFTINLATRAITNITKGVPRPSSTSRTRRSSKPPFGMAGWTKDDAAVVIRQIRPVGTAGDRGGREVLDNG